MKVTGPSAGQSPCSPSGRSLLRVAWRPGSWGPLTTPEASWGVCLHTQATGGGGELLEPGSQPQLLMSAPSPRPRGWGRPELGEHTAWRLHDVALPPSLPLPAPHPEPRRPPRCPCTPLRALCVCSGGLCTCPSTREPPCPAPSCQSAQLLSEAALVTLWKKAVQPWPS